MCQAAAPVKSVNFKGRPVFRFHRCGVKTNARLDTLYSSSFSSGLVMQNRVQQRTVDFDMPVVADQAKLAELVHEMADARSGGANHLGQCFLTDIRSDRLRTAFLAEMREQQQHAGKPPLA